MLTPPISPPSHHAGRGTMNQLSVGSLPPPPAFAPGLPDFHIQSSRLTERWPPRDVRGRGVDPFTCTVTSSQVACPSPHPAVGGPSDPGSSSLTRAVLSPPVGERKRRAPAGGCTTSTSWNGCRRTRGNNRRPLRL